MKRSVLWASVLISCFVAYVVELQPPGCNQTAHYSLVESLAHGSPSIDRFHNQTCDTAYVGGHYFAAKAPGLALATLPWYGVLRLVHAVPRNPGLADPFPTAMLQLPRKALWELGLFGAALPALVLLILFGKVAARLHPGSETAAAVLLGLGTLVFPFATVLFAHVLAACLAFASFAVLFFRRSPVLAGVLAGLAAVVDFPLGIIALALAVYAWPRTWRFVPGAIVGLLPAAAFNEWAFRDPFRLAYANAVLEPGTSGHAVLGANGSGFFGVGVPSLRSALELLFSPRGLFTLSPIMAVAAAGLVLVWRRGFRREAALAAALALVFLVYNSGYYVPFGGYVPGPRFLIAVIPFLALGLPSALAAWPVPTVLLGGFSIAAMTVATAAEPLLGSDDTHSWIVRWQHGDFAQSVVTLLGAGHSWLAVTPLLVAVVVATLLAATQMHVTHATAQALAAVALWFVVFRAAPELLQTDRAVHQSTGMLAVIALVVVATLLVTRFHGWAILIGLPLLALAAHRLSAHTKDSLAVVAVVALAVAVLEARRRAFSGPRAA